MTDLSPAAHAVLRAAGDSDPGIYATIAAALRSAADQVVPLTAKPNDEFCCPPVYSMLWESRAKIRQQLLAIATEFEGEV